MVELAATLFVGICIVAAIVVAFGLFAGGVMLLEQWQENWWSSYYAKHQRLAEERRKHQNAPTSRPRRPEG